MREPDPSVLMTIVVCAKWQYLHLIVEKVRRYDKGLRTQSTITNYQCTQRLYRMCDNTAPCTAQENHLVTTKFKIVYKYTVL